MMGIIPSLVFMMLFNGCATTDVNKPDENISSLAHAKMLHDQERYREAMIECIDLSRENSLLPGLPELQHEIISALSAQRAEAARIRVKTTRQRMMLDVDQNKTVPSTYGMKRKVRGENSPLRTEPTAMQKALKKNVTVHLDNVTLDNFILAIGTSENINIISDTTEEVDDDEKITTMTVHAEDVPLSEILDYVSRNLGVAFYVGENLIWATPEKNPGKPNIPMETRMYRLRKGLSSDELTAGDNRINIVDAIERFVPSANGSDLMFNKKAHVLIVKNTRDNLTKVEKIIETLDVCPPQVLIEARFITTSVNDLTELGINWILNSPISVSDKMVKRSNGGESARTETEIAEGGGIGYGPFSPSGLNMTYQGILTDPMFSAVLHALETSGNTRTLSVPRVTTVNNKEALIRIGQDFRYFEEYDVQSTPSTSDDGQTIYHTILVPVGTPKLQKLGIELIVTPSVGADMGSIDLKMVPKITEFVRFYTALESSSTNTPQIQLPIFRISEIETEVIVQSGETVAMGGLITATESKSKQGIPLLSWIPIIGRLFRHDIVEEKKENLLIFVTATILSERGESLIPFYGE